MAKRRLRRGALAIVALLGLVALAAPYLSADRLRGRIQEALQASLGRPVEIRDKVRFQLLSGPGFTIQDVVIQDTVDMGAEPLAYVDAVQARVRLRSLFSRRLEFSAVRLVEPSVNLVRRRDGHWNVEPLLRHTAVASEQSSATLPTIEVRGGRLNLKDGDTKQAFYLSNADADLTMDDDQPGRFRFRFVAQPARTDRAEQGLGTFRGVGRWNGTQSGGGLDLDLRLERSGIAELSALFLGQTFGVQGLVGARAHLTGPPRDLRVEGEVELENVTRWEFFPQRFGLRQVRYEGRLDLIEQRVEMRTAGPAGAALPVEARVRGEGLFRLPRWTATLALRDVPLEVLPPLARHLGASVPEALQWTGKASGEVDYGEAEGWRGQVRLTDASLTLPSVPTLSVPTAEVAFAGGQIRLSPVVVSAGKEVVATVEGSYDRQTRALSSVLDLRPVDVGALRSALAYLPGEPLPLLAHVANGTVQGRVAYLPGAVGGGQWEGRVALQNGTVPVSGVSEPVRVRSATLTLEGERIVANALRGSLGTIEWEGEYRYEPGTPRPHRVRVASPAVDAAELERLLLPTLRRDTSLLARTLRFRTPPLPEWLESRRAEGSIRVARFRAGEAELRGLRARLAWEAGQLRLSDLEARVQDGLLRGGLRVDLSSRVTRYRLEGGLRELRWKGGTVDAEGTVESSGTGAEVWQNLKANGTFQAHSLRVPPEGTVQSATGTYEYTVRRGAPLVRLDSLEVAMGPDMLKGQGGAEQDNRLRIDLTNGTRQVRMVGSLSPLRLDAVAQP